MINLYKIKNHLRDVMTLMKVDLVEEIIHHPDRTEITAEMLYDFSNAIELAIQLEEELENIYEKYS